MPKEALPSVEQMVNRQFDQTELPKLLKREGPVAAGPGMEAPRQRQLAGA